MPRLPPLSNAAPPLPPPPSCEPRPCHQQWGWESQQPHCLWHLAQHNKRLTWGRHSQSQPQLQWWFRSGLLLPYGLHRRRLPHPPERVPLGLAPDRMPWRAPRQSRDGSERA